jgi:hypothetical protein
MSNPTGKRCQILRSRLVSILVKNDCWLTVKDITEELYLVGQLKDSAQRIGNVLATTRGVKRLGTDPQQYKMKDGGQAAFLKWLNR